jgi:hypothetical protein
MLRMYSPEAQNEVWRTLQEFHQGRLVIGSEAKIPVTSLRQALAIGRARARRKEAEKAPLRAWPIEP